DPRRARDGGVRERGQRRRALARLPHRRGTVEQLRHQAHRAAERHLPGLPRAVQEDGGGMMAALTSYLPLVGRSKGEALRVGGEAYPFARTPTRKMLRCALHFSTSPQGGGKK